MLRGVFDGGSECDVVGKMSVETLIAQLHQLEAQRDAYLETFNKAQQAVKESLAKVGESQRESQRENQTQRRDTRTSLSLEVPALPSSPTFEAPLPGLTISPPPLSRKPSHIGHGFRDSNPALSNYDASTLTDDSESEDEDVFYVQDHLPTQSFDHEHLRDHLKKYPFDVYGRQILSNVISDKGRLKDPSLFPSHETEEKKNYSHYQVFDVGQEGVPVALATSNEFDQTVSKARQIWLAIKDINAGATDERAVGRITYVYSQSVL